MANPTNMLRIEGDTYQHRKTLISSGYKWNAEKKRWYQELSDSMAAKVRAGDKHWMYEVLNVNLKGCQATLGGEVIYTSKTYAAAQSQPKPVARDVYACDAAGNYCGGPVIPGSAPDDLMW